MLEICTYRNAKTPIKTIVFDGNNILTENVLKSAVNLNELKRSIYFGLNSTGEEKLYPSILSTTIIVMLSTMAVAFIIFGMDLVWKFFLGFIYAS